MIEVRGLTKRYGDRLAIENLNFSVSKGEVVGFLGPNGAGKSTTMKIITGYMAPSSGEVQVAGFDVFENPIDVKKRIGYLPETPPVYGDMRVRDYLAFVARLKGVPRSKTTSMVDVAIDKANLKDVADRLIQNLSKGYRQRVGLAQALVSDPEILILDEPTVGLDPKQVQEVRRLIQGLRGHHTIVLSTHILPEVQASCSRIIIINSGKIIAEDSLDGLSRRMGGKKRVFLRLRRKQQELCSSLENLPGVTKVDNAGSEIIAETDGLEDTIEGLSSHVVEKGAGLIEFRTEGMNLEDIFIKLTSSDNSANLGGL
ncbi:MAG: ABC transporter ATP-binding protein [Bdellovibrionales bacterium]|nr:ABC transporter ATP-binding protein [Bdellovibrionales bacterium]